MSDKPDVADLLGAAHVTTFLGLPACENPAHASGPAALIGAPCATPYSGVGPYSRNAPQALRRSIAGFSANIDRHNFDLGGPIFPPGTPRAVDCGDLDWDAADFAANRAAIEGAVRAISAAGPVPVVLGGDDSIPIPMIAAFSDLADCSILQIDAHIDWRKEHMGETLGLSSTMRRAAGMDHVTRIVQVGARGTGSAHSDDVADALAWGARIIGAEAFHAGGDDPVFEHLPEGSDLIVCIDVDGLDPSIVPGVLGPTPGGLSYFQLLGLLRRAIGRYNVRAINFVEYVPEVDVGGLGAVTVSRMIAATLGLLARKAAG